MPKEGGEVESDVRPSVTKKTGWGTAALLAGGFVAVMGVNKGMDTLDGMAEVERQSSIEARQNEHEAYIQSQKIEMTNEIFEEVGRMPTEMELDVATGFSMMAYTDELRKFISELKTGKLSDVAIMTFISNHSHGTKIYPLSELGKPTTE